MRYRRCLCGQEVEERAGICPACGSDVLSAPLQAGGGAAATATGDPPASLDWFYMSDGRIVGPCQIEEIQTNVAVGVLPADTMIWTPGMKEWKAASELLNIEEIAPLAAAETEVEFGEEVDPDEWNVAPDADPELAALLEENPIEQHARRKAEEAARVDPEVQSAIDALGDTKPHPYMRWGARMIDIALTGFVLGVLMGIFAPHATMLDNSAMATFFALAVWAGLEPLVMTHLENTPGKAMLNVHVRTAAGRSLTLEEAARRSFRVWVFGLAAGLPLVNLFTMALARRKLVKEGRTSWDQEGDFVVAHGPIDSRRVLWILAFLAAYVLLTVISALP